MPDYAPLLDQSTTPKPSPYPKRAKNIVAGVLAIVLLLVAGFTIYSTSSTAGREETTAAPATSVLAPTSESVSVGSGTEADKIAGETVPTPVAGVSASHHAPNAPVMIGDGDDDEEPADHELMHGEPGVADPLTGIFGEVNSMTAPDDGKWKTALSGYKFVVQLGSMPPVFVAKPSNMPDQGPTDPSLMAVMTRALADSVAESMEDDDGAPVAQLVFSDCHIPDSGYAHAAILAAVRGASTTHCILPAVIAPDLSPLIMAAARLNLVDEKMRLHAVDNTSTASIDNLPLSQSPIALLHLKDMSLSHMSVLLQTSPKIIGRTNLRHIVADISSTVETSDADLRVLLDHMYELGYDMNVLPFSEQDRTYTHIARASYVGAEFAAEKFPSLFIYVPSNDYSLVKKVVEDGGAGGRMRVWWVRREDESVKRLMSTRHDAD
ncbi:hypothetical protein HKX48_005021 [Thoreauomyces humboldtii]|nr:hypothetical protein HKX48_005021 [Thoreauomyces humboldtii]